MFTGKEPSPQRTCCWVVKDPKEIDLATAELENSGNFQFFRPDFDIEPLIPIAPSFLAYDLDGRPISSDIPTGAHIFPTEALVLSAWEIVQKMNSNQAAGPMPEELFVTQCRRINWLESNSHSTEIGPSEVIAYAAESMARKPCSFEWKDVSLNLKALIWFSSFCAKWPRGENLPLPVVLTFPLPINVNDENIELASRALQTCLRGLRPSYRRALLAFDYATPEGEKLLHNISSIVGFVYSLDGPLYEFIP